MDYEGSASVNMGAIFYSPTVNLEDDLVTFVGHLLACHNSCVIVGSWRYISPLHLYSSVNVGPPTGYQPMLPVAKCSCYGDYQFTTAAIMDDSRTAFTIVSKGFCDAHGLEM